MQFDFTPDPKVLIALTHTPIQPLDALCELIDNAIDSFYIAKIQGLTIENKMIFVTLPSRKQLSLQSGVLRIQDNGCGMNAKDAEKAIRAGFSGNNPYDTLGLFGMGFNISTGKLGNKTTFMTSRKEADTYIKTEIDLSKINNTKNYSLEAVEIPKNSSEPFNENEHGTIIEVTEWWPEGNANNGFIQKLVQYGLPKIREEIGRRYATILRKGEVRILINGEKCEAFEHCVWGDSRFVIRRSGNVPAIIRLNQTIGNSNRCAKCTAIIPDGASACPSCGSNNIRTIEEKVTGWIGIQRFDSDTDYGIDLIRNGRAIRTAEKNAFFEFVDEFKHTTKDYPIDSQYGRIVGEINLDFVPVDFLKQDFQRNSAEWAKAMTFIRGNSSLQPSQPGANENISPLYKLYQAYRRVRQFGKGDLYMGYWDADERCAKRISRDIEKQYYEKFKQKLPGFYDDSEWWKLVESADQPPVEKLPECPNCSAQNMKEAEVCLCCGQVLKGKICINEECRQNIPLSAQICPHCGFNQTPIVIEPWTCKVCGRRNIATNETCVACKSHKGTEYPLSKKELLKISDKVDALSLEGLTMLLADGSVCHQIKVQVYATKQPIVTPITNESIPLVISKEIGNLVMFVDFSHPYFTKCGLSKEQLIASEIAMYLYQDRMDLSSKAEHNLSNLTWLLLESNWKDEVEISFEKTFKDTEDLLKDIQIRLKENSNTDVSSFFTELTNEQKKQMTDALLSNKVDLKEIGSLVNSGEYLTYTPYSFLMTLFNEDPDMFFGGKVWETSLACGGEELLGAEIVAQAREKLIRQYSNYLQDLILFYENKYTDITTIQRVKLSVDFLRESMTL